MLSKEQAQALIEQVVGSPVVLIGNCCSEPGCWEAQTKNADWAYAARLRNGRVRVSVYKANGRDEREVIL